MESVAENLRTVRTEEIDDPIAGPYMGWGIWAGARYFDGRSFTLEYNTTGFGDGAPLFSWLLIDWMWADLEPEEGRYQWDELDAIVHFWSDHGKQIELRVWITDDPGWNGAPGNTVCPEWLWKDGAPFHEYRGYDNTIKREPSYADPSYEKVYLPKARKFLSAVVERYGKPGSPITQWGAMGYGQWGEWHTYVSRYPWPNVEIKHRVLSKVVNMYAEVFGGRLLRIALAPEDNPRPIKTMTDFLYDQAVGLALEKGFALAYHGFIDGRDPLCKWMFMKYWRRLSLWAEGNWSYTEVKDEGTHGTLNENLDVMTDWHSTYAHLYMDADSYKRAMKEDRETFERGLRKGGLGYRLVLTEVSWDLSLRPGDLLVLRQEWVNRNCARLYIRHALKVYLTDFDGEEKYSEVDDGFDSTSWTAGETYHVNSVFHLLKGLLPGDYDVRLALVGEDGRPRIKLGITGEDSEGRYRLGTLRILAPKNQ